MDNFNLKGETFKNLLFLHRTSSIDWHKAYVARYGSDDPFSADYRSSNAPEGTEFALDEAMEYAEAVEAEIQHRYNIMTGAI